MTLRKSGTVWKIQDFSITGILREINFREFRNFHTVLRSAYLHQIFSRRHPFWNISIMVIEKLVFREEIFRHLVRNYFRACICHLCHVFGKIHQKVRKMFWKTKFETFASLTSNSCWLISNDRRLLVAQISRFDCFWKD